MPTQEDIDRKIFDTTFDQPEQSKEDEAPSPTVMYSDYLTPLGVELEALWQEAERNRDEIEDRWAKDLRQYKGEYDPEVLARMHPKRSKANLPITRTKVKTIDSRMTDILFPANKDKNWSINITPIPELDPMTTQQIAMQFEQQTGQAPTMEMIQKEINTQAQARCDAMETEMDDQLSEIKYRNIIRQVIHSGNIYGTGILKGPLVKESVSKRWLPNGDDWATIEIKRYVPYIEFVPVWDIYPDMTARKPEDMRYIWQRYVMNRNQVYELAQRSDFKSDVIEAYLRAHREGDAKFKNHEETLREMSEGSENTPGTAYSGKYEVREFWGYLSSDKLVEQGIQISEEQLGLEFAANVWMLGPLVIKAVLSPLEGVTFPYFWYYYEKDETSIFGEGIPSIMRDPQSLYNAAIRAMLDNAAISAGPIIEANMELLSVDEDPTDIYPFRVFQRSGLGAEANSKAIQVYNIDSHSSELMALANYFAESADEVTAIPRYLYGESGSVGQAGQTASGLSMLMGAVNITIKDQIKNFDDGITKCFVKALYHWNMDFNPKEAIKGDFNVVAKGSTSLIAKEVRSEQLNQFMAITANDYDMMYVKRDALLREVIKNYELEDLDLIKDANTVAIEAEQRAKAENEQMQFERELAMTKAQSGGHMVQESEPKPTDGIM